MSYALVPDFSVPMPPRPVPAVTVAVECKPLAVPIGRFPECAPQIRGAQKRAAAAAVTITVEAVVPARSQRMFDAAGDVLAALVLIVGGAVLIGCATLL